MNLLYTSIIQYFRNNFLPVFLATDEISKRFILSEHGVGVWLPHLFSSSILTISTQIDITFSSARRLKVNSLDTTR